MKCIELAKQLNKVNNQQELYVIVKLLSNHYIHCLRSIYLDIHCLRNIYVAPKSFTTQNSIIFAVLEEYRIRAEYNKEKSIREYKQKMGI